MPYYYLLMSIIGAFIILHTVIGFLGCILSNDPKFIIGIIVISILVGSVIYLNGSYIFVDRKGDNHIMLITVDNKRYITYSYKINDDVISFIDIKGIKYNIDVSEIDKYQIEYYR